MDFWKAIEILGKRKWLIAGCVAVCFMLAVAFTKFSGSRYAATVDFVEPSHDQAAQSTGADAGDDSDGQDPASQARVYLAIMKSPNVIQPVLSSIGLQALPPDFFKNVDLNAIGPRLFELTVTDSSEQRAAQIANGLASQLVDFNQQIHTAQAHKIAADLQTQFAIATDSLNRAQRKYDHYRSEHKLIGNFNSDLDAAFTRLNSLQNQRDDEAVKLADAQARETATLAQISTVKAASPMDLAGTDAPLQQEWQELTDANQKLAALRSVYLDSYPLVQQALRYRDDLQAQYDHDTAGLGMSESHNPNLALLNQELRQSRIDVAGAQATIATLDDSLRDAQDNLSQFKGVDSPLDSLAQEVAQLDESRNSIATRLQSAQAAEDLAERQTPLTVLMSVGPFNPVVNLSHGRMSKLALLAALAGLVSSCALFIALDAIDQRLRSVRQAEAALSTSVLAAIPQPAEVTRYSYLARITEHQPKSLQSEAYRFLGLHVLTESQNPIRSLMVLAAKAEQGSTTTISNLAITLAQAGRRVIIVDANMRTTEVHKVFELPNQYGFADLLMNPTTSSLERAIQQTSIPNLQVITAGSAPENPWQLFRSQSLIEVSHRLHALADFVLYDTPSSLMFTDALNLAPIVDAAILCVRALEPLTGMEERLISLLEHVNVRVIGSVLHDVPVESVEGFNNYTAHYLGSGDGKALNLLTRSMPQDAHAN